MKDLEYLSGLEMGKLVNSGELSPTEIIKFFSKKIEERNPAVNAFTYVKIEEAQEAAKKLEQRLAQHEDCGPFAGVPVGLKDFLPSKVGWTNSHGGVSCLIQRDKTNSEFTKAAEALGAIPIGKTNAPAFGFSGCCENHLYGPTRNPFDLARTSGGSSGGSAAAVADGMAVICEGGDAGGSIRIPASWCNLFGFKPSLGTVPSYCRPDGWAATHPYCFNGCLTKTVEDSATMLNKMARYDPRDPISLPINANKDFVELMKKSPDGLRIGITADFDLYPVDSEIVDIIDYMALKLQRAGLIVEPIQFNFKHSLQDFMTTWAWSISVDTAIEINQWRERGLDLLTNHKDQLPEEFEYFNRMAMSAGIDEMYHFNRVRTDILDNFEDVFSKYDLIISPTCACKPVPTSMHGHLDKINEWHLDPLTNFISFAETPLVNFIGYPAASVPAGMTNDNLPVGMQIIGKQYHDEDVLSLSYFVEQMSPWRRHYSLTYR